MNDELQQKKYQYEKIIKDLDSCYIKLEKCYSNLVLCKDKIKNTLDIDGNFYNCKEYEKIIADLENKMHLIKDVFLSEIRYEYNMILSKLSNLY